MHGWPISYADTRRRSRCEGQAADRPCPEDRSLSVRAAFAQEQPKLLALPDNPFPTDEREVVGSGKTPYVRFDRNDYSIPHTHVRRSLSVVASPTEVRIVDGTEVIAHHPRSYDKGKQVEDPAHIADLTARKRHARHHRGQDRLARAVPNRAALLTRAAALLRLLDRYGTAAREAGIAEALRRDVPPPNAVHLALERLREQRERPPPLPIALPADKRIRDLVLSPPSSMTTTSCKPTRRTRMTTLTTDDPLRARAKALKRYGMLACLGQRSKRPLGSPP